MELSPTDFRVINSFVQSYACEEEKKCPVITSQFVDDSVILQAIFNGNLDEALLFHSGTNVSKVDRSK
jgi:hypothetical protein